MTDKCFHLHTLNFGLALGVTWAIGVFLLGIVAAWLGWGHALVHPLGSLYIGFEATLVGSLIGAIWGFVDAFIFGVILAFFYNLFNRCCPRCPKSCPIDEKPSEEKSAE